jgi:hypothetical protein
MFMTTPRCLERVLACPGGVGLVRSCLPGIECAVASSGRVPVGFSPLSLRAFRSRTIIIKRPHVGERNERAFALIFDAGRHGQPANGSRAVRDKDQRLSGRK